MNAARWPLKKNVCIICVVSRTEYSFYLDQRELEKQQTVSASSTSKESVSTRDRTVVAFLNPISTNYRRRRLLLLLSCASPARAISFLSRPCRCGKSASIQLAARALAHQFYFTGLISIQPVTHLIIVHLSTNFANSRIFFYGDINSLSTSWEILILFCTLAKIKQSILKKNKPLSLSPSTWFKVREKLSFTSSISPFLKQGTSCVCICVVCPSPFLPHQLKSQVCARRAKAGSRWPTA